MKCKSFMSTGPLCVINTQLLVNLKESRESSCKKCICWKEIILSEDLKHLILLLRREIPPPPPPKPLLLLLWWASQFSMGLGECCEHYWLTSILASAHGVTGQKNSLTASHQSVGLVLHRISHSSQPDAPRKSIHSSWWPPFSTLATQATGIWWHPASEPDAPFNHHGQKLVTDVSSMNCHLSQWSSSPQHMALNYCHLCIPSWQFHCAIPLNLQISFLISLHQFRPYPLYLSGGPESVPLYHALQLTISAILKRY